MQYLGRVDKNNIIKRSIPSLFTFTTDSSLVQVIFQGLPVHTTISVHIISQYCMWVSIQFIECCSVAEWARAINRPDLLELAPGYVSRNCIVCSEHFDVTSFLNDLHTRLQPSAVPNINMEHCQMVTRPEDTSKKVKLTSNGEHVIRIHLFAPCVCNSQDECSGT